MPSLSDTIPRDSVRISPGKAFYRSLLVPGWGQASVGAYVRGGTFFAVQSASAYMMLKTMARLGEAREIEERRIASARDSLSLLMERDAAAKARLTDPDVFQAAIDSTTGVRRIRELIDSRRSQRQDWITYTLVSTLARGVDAFVAAHLPDFPAALDARPRVGGGLELQLTV